MPNLFQLQFHIEENINDLLQRWCHETHRITIESFKRNTDYLIIFRIGNWNEPTYFWKTAISVRRDDERSFQQLLSLFFFQTVCFSVHLDIFKGKC